MIVMVMALVVGIYSVIEFEIVIVVIDKLVGTYSVFVMVAGINFVLVLVKIVVTYFVIAIVEIEIVVGTCFVIVVAVKENIVGIYLVETIVGSGIEMKKADIAFAVMEILVVVDVAVALVVNSESCSGLIPKIDVS